MLSRFTAGGLLIIEGKTCDLEYVRREISFMGFRHYTTHNVEEALGILARQNVSAVISDIQIPERTGIFLLDILRTRGEYTPFLFLTDQNSKPSMIKVMQLGAHDFLNKPFDPEDLQEAVLRTMRIRRPSPNLPYLSFDHSAEA